MNQHSTMASTAHSSSLRAWASRIALSIAVALAAGALAFLVARAVTSVLLFVQEQQFLSEVASTLRGGLDELPNGNLHEIRQRVQALDARYLRLSLAVGFAVSGLAVVGTYLWLERRAAVSVPPTPSAETTRPHST